MYQWISRNGMLVLTATFARMDIHMYNILHQQNFLFIKFYDIMRLQCSDTVGLASGRASGL